MLLNSLSLLTSLGQSTPFIIETIFISLIYFVYLILVKAGTPTCPFGWRQLKSYCYLVSSSIKTWHQAQGYCHAMKAQLVKINSLEENEFVLSLVKQRTPSLKQVWIGLMWDSSTKDFLWSDYSVPVYKNWAPGEPNGKGREPCAHMWTGQTTHMPHWASGYWNDLPCAGHPKLPCGPVYKRLP